MKPLKILLGNNTLSLLAGSETWTYTLAVQLKKMGHKVSCFSPELGIIAEKLQEQGIPCYNDLNAQPIRPFTYVLEEKFDHDYDVIICNHNHIVEYLRAQYPTKPIISTIHGILHFMDEEQKERAPEHPALESGVNQFVAVSEEIQEKLKKDYNIDSVIIRQPLDIKALSSLPDPTPGKPKQFLVNTNYAGREDAEIVAIRDAAKIMGARVNALGVNFAQQFDITKAIQDSDVVFGMGRSVLEGVGAGRLGIVQGRWGTGGVICESKLEEIRKFNYSGRNSEYSFKTAEELVELIEKYYTPETLEWGKKMTAKDHNVAFIAEEYIRIARELTGEAYSKPSLNNGVDPQAKKFRLAND